MRRLTITAKITIWYTAFLLVITTGVLGMLVHMGNERASEAAKTRLTLAVGDSIEEITADGSDFIIDKDLDFYEDGVYISVYDAAGNLIEGRRPVELEQDFAFENETVRKAYDGDGVVWYVYDNRFAIDAQSLWVRGIVKDFAEQGTFYFVMNLSVVALPGLVAAAALGGYFITRRAFRPVRQIIDTVEEISRDGDLSRRVYLKEKKQHRDGKAVKDEVHKLASTFNSMFDKLERVFQQEKQFTSDVSHELRTPLTVIISQSDYAREDAAYREHALDTINKEAKRMAGLVNRLLTLARSDAGRLKLQKETLDFSSLCETVAAQQDSMAAQKKIRIETDIKPDIFIHADGEMIIRVLLNLMENAVKYGKEQGLIVLTLDVDGPYARCAIQDDGIGIAVEDLEKIWERFYRVDAARSEEGSGLGLSMVEALVRAHDGKVQAASRPGEGSVFTVMLPLHKQNEPEENA